MNTHALIAEETGYRDSRLQKPIACFSPHYLKGYRQGTRARRSRYRKGRHRYEGMWEAYQAFLKQFGNGSESKEKLCKPPRH